MGACAATPDVPIRNPTEIVEIPGEELVERIDGTVEGTLYSLVEYDITTLNVVYADEETLQFYRDRDHLLAHFDRIHSHAHRDFEQMELFLDDLFPVADRVDYIITAMDFMKLVRVYNDRNGLFIAIEPDEPVQPIIGTIRDIRDGARDGG